mgnify:CR=1 FL=1
MPGSYSQARERRRTVRHQEGSSQGPDQSRFVRAVDGSLVDVSEIDPHDRHAKGPYSCLACGHIMVPALGRVRKHHFKHKAGRPPDCHRESYLHQLAKMTLYTALRSAMREDRPYWLTRERPAICSHYLDELGLTCTGKTAPFQVDLAAMFDRVEMEAGAGGFVADVLLSSTASGARMLLEVAVSHPCDAEKIASGLQIIEIEIGSEEAAARLAHGIDATGGTAICHNLPDPEPAPYLCSSPCTATALIALLYSSGKVWYAEAAIGGEAEILSDPHLAAHEIVEVALGHQGWTQAEIMGHLKAFMTRLAFEEGRSVRSCLMCWNNGGRANEHDIHCIAKGRRVWMSSSASGCTDYEPAADPEDAERLFSS